MKNNKYKDWNMIDRQHPSAKIIFKRIDILDTYSSTQDLINRDAGWYARYTTTLYITMKLKFGMPAGQPLVVAYWHPHHINLKKLLRFLAMKGDLAIHQLATSAPWID
jgi:hypothetical protein